MACDCIATMDRLLAKHNTKLQVTFAFGRDGSSATYPSIGTEKIERRTRKGPMLAIPTYCPFCGVRYSPAPAEPAGADAAPIEAGAPAEADAPSPNSEAPLPDDAGEQARRRSSPAPAQAGDRGTNPTGTGG
ncbi:hypothetical protein [Sphingosinicella sp. CPCC 101087]|uniref:hypothetical protein n=1 Tax=Sphingosinicella sp. CPCC 101087 TaxID=2497754 RepID=UPI0013EC8C3A|nr:hypothetical protein [Sphingosinicella sp. CPCC 101087]